MKVVHLTVARIATHKSSGAPVFERKTVKLEDGNDFNNFVKNIPISGYFLDEESDKPKVVKVIETNAVVKKTKDDLDQIKEDVTIKSKELNEIAKYQKIVDDAIKPAEKEENSKGIDTLKEENAALKKRMDEMEAMIKNSAKGEEKPEPQAPTSTPEPTITDDEKEKLIEEIKDRGGNADKRMGIEKLNDILSELKKED